MRLLLLGPQGCGKTTQAKLLSQRLNICAICAGEMLRQIAQEDNGRGRSVTYSLKHGQMVDSRIATDAVKEKIAQPECQNGFVIDGPPRKLADMEFFNPDFDVVVYLSLSDDLGVERLLKRGRGDDTPELIKARLLLFHQETGPVIDHYKQMGILFTVDAAESIDKVTEEIIQKLEVFLKNDCQTRNRG